MTELEQQLVSAFEDLESEWQKQQSLSEKALQALRSSFEGTAEQNRALTEQVTSLALLCTRLSEQVQGLNKQVQGLSEQVNDLK